MKIIEYKWYIIVNFLSTKLSFWEKINNNSKNKLVTPPIKWIMMMLTTQLDYDVERVKYSEL